jgi:putative restriction endonuclease
MHSVVFGQANGTTDERALLERLNRLANRLVIGGLDRLIGCIAITQPVFFAPDEWVEVPANWSRNIVSGRIYDLTTGFGLRLWQECLVRLAVLDAYGGVYAVTTEHSLPVVEAAHIKPWKDGGRHEVVNGLPLRRDIHRLFDLGFVTVRPNLDFAVSPALRDAYANGRADALDGRRIRTPSDPSGSTIPRVARMAWR